MRKNIIIVIILLFVSCRKYVPFDVFCEEILPYKVANEPLENWRKKALTSYTKLNSSFKTQPGITAVEACIQVNSQLPRLQLSTDVPDMNFSMIMTATRGMCDEMVTLAIFTMRALGIPVSKDFILKWSNHYVGHSWNSGYRGIDKRFSFMGTEENPQQEGQWNEKICIRRTQVSNLFSHLNCYNLSRY